MHDPTVDAAHAFLRGHSTAEIRFDEHLRPLHYVVAPDGLLVAPVMVAMLQSMDTVLFVPECSEDAMELSVTLLPLEEHGPEGGLCDRWRIFHGDPPDVRWARMSIDAARYAGMVIDGEALMRPNPLAAEEAAICREVNTGRLEDLRRAAERVSGVDVPEPRLVGVDPGGLDVRARFGVIRVPLAVDAEGGEAGDAAAVRAAIDRLLSGDSGDAPS
ncbi:MAG: hypothetical protein ACYTEV_06065 [Planctomycetota bacterium]|jgi:hypothetical protein